MITNDPADLKLFDVLRVGVLLLAFVVALYALLARERKLPYVTNSVFYITYAVLLALLAALVISIASSHGYRLPGGVADAIALVSFAAIVFIYWKVFTLHNRVKNLRHDHSFRNIAAVQWCKNKIRRLRNGPTYEHRPAKIPDELLSSLKQSPYVPAERLEWAADRNRGGQDSISGIYTLQDQNEANDVIADLSYRFLSTGHWVQYTTSSRHPIEFLISLKAHSEEKSGDWAEISNRLVLVDAFTPHFGFADSIHAVKSEEARQSCLAYLISKPSFAGIHTAGAAAFNKIKKQSGGNLRGPTLVVYEGLHSLVDLESSEQYRIFYSHVLPSERLWGSMFTVIVEFRPSKDNLDHLTAFGDFFYKTIAQGESSGQETTKSSDPKRTRKKRTQTAVKRKKS